jgi:hydrogenase expression/formation protein HypD
MKFLKEYRDASHVLKFVEMIRTISSRQWTIMEICGGQTHALLKYGIDELIREQVNLLHGPGCPVCVTPLEIIDKALYLASREDVLFCSFGDMLRVPGSDTDLLHIKSRGGDIRMVYSPLDAVKLAQKHPEKEVVFFGVGFETTAPTIAMAIEQAKVLGLKNFSVLISHVLVPPAMEAILSSPNNRVNGFLAAGHVCTVMGYEEYIPIAEKYQVPIVVTGFEPLDLIQGIYMCVKQLEEGRHEVENQYARSVKKEGNIHAKQLMKKIFQVVPRKWRGIGEIPQSGLGLRPEYDQFDAEKKFSVEKIEVKESPQCISGEILQGYKKPVECPAFGNDCTPEHPLGATMVSSEGACAAYYRYKS